MKNFYSYIVIIDHEQYQANFKKVNLNQSMSKDDDVGNLICLIQKN